MLGLSDSHASVNLRAVLQTRRCYAGEIMTSAAVATPRSHSTSEPARIPELDGLRGIAILAVMIFHFGATPLSPGSFRKVLEIGWSGVDLFFVLSGFLITGILLRTKERSRYFFNFYTRRTLRIFPLYYGCLVLLFLVVLPLVRSGPVLALRADAPWYWLHLSNFRTAWGPFSGSFVGHFWSLAVEEQFYLVWPLIVLLLPERALLWTCLAVPVASCIVRSLPPLQTLERAYPDFLYRITFFRLDGLALGAAAAVLARHPRLIQRAAPVARVLLPLSLAALGAIIFADQSALFRGRWMSSFGFSVIATIFAAVLFLTVTRAIDGRVFRAGWLRSFGTYSYGMYMFHAPVLTLMPKLLHVGSILGSVLFVTVFVPLCYAVAWLSWHVYEIRFLKLKERLTS